MKFERIEDDVENEYYFQKRNKETNITICLYSVMYGTRVRVYKSKYGCEVDYCCGDDNAFCEKVYSLIEGILENMQNIKEYDDFKWPAQQMKPIFNDLDCLKQLVKLLKENSLKKQENFPNINVKRAGTITKLFENIV